MEEHRRFAWVLRVCAVFIGLFCMLAEGVLAEVVRWEVQSREILANGRLFGKAGAYEKVKGRLHYAIDPDDASNQAIVDLDLAPRGPDGRVHFTGDAIFMQPLDPQRRHGTILLDVPNRGQRTLYRWFHGLEVDNEAPWMSQPLLLEKGFALLSVGWQMDTPYDSELLSLDRVEAAVDEVGLLRSDAVFKEVTAVMPLAHRNHRPYGVSDPDDARNQLTVRDEAHGARRPIDRTQWRFSRLDKAGKVVSDPFWVHLDGGFEAGKIYEVVYVANRPTVNGLGLTAIRDAASYFKYESGGRGQGASKAPRRLLAWGASQAGRLLRQVLYEGLAVDGKGRQVFDGVWIHGAGAGRGSFNHRFAEASRDGHAFASFFYPVDLPPFTSQQGLYDRWRQASKRGTSASGGAQTGSAGDGLPAKVVLTHTSYEYWSRGASLTHTTLDGQSDAELDAQERIYFLAGTQHLLNPWASTAAAHHPVNHHDYRYALRALLVAFDGWLQGGPALPPSQFPKVADETLVKPEALSFPALPEIDAPDGPYRPVRLDFGQRFSSHGIIDHQPPKVGEPWPVLVPQVNQDGNELAGVRLPLVGVPTAVYTGWNLRRAQDGGKDQLALFRGSMFPLPGPESGAMALEERYPGTDQYLRRVNRLARKMVQEGFLLNEDLVALEQQAILAWRFALASRDVEEREPFQIVH